MIKRRIVLFVGAATLTGLLFGLLPGLCQPLQKYPTLRREILRREKGWLLISLAGCSIFLLISSWPMLFGSFILLGY